MVIADADGPLLERQLAPLATNAAVVAERLLGPGAAEHERACIGRVGEQVVHAPVARSRPPHAPLAGPPAR